MFKPLLKTEMDGLWNDVRFFWSLLISCRHCQCFNTILIVPLAVTRYLIF